MKTLTEINPDAMKTDNSSKIILATLTGVASGVIVGILLAPDKGRATRKKISKTGDKYLKNIRKDISELQKYLNKRTELAKAKLETLGKNASNKKDELVSEAKRLTSYDQWTKDELYEKAKELNVDGYSRMNKDELIEALKNS
ncbi:YtxH domain-containing protein [Aliifodinibius sp. S!AR15-10]|uniref:YtxH domain-containing protein n=1 Tax=Aliifodinibius sp. S!AR15-10 TaxID=2950437 RepID=UPI0028627610|nr:YtxH domain-containing protein [Aliifodinibius sp. S!AR15-10]MDR8389551.1 YtxH domain-containing protein [Aliifodinibius sp. S!AR15-10]